MRQGPCHSAAEAPTPAAPGKTLVGLLRANPRIVRPVRNRHKSEHRAASGERAALGRRDATADQWPKTPMIAWLLLLLGVI
jgi:hypothetical protein